MTAAAEQHADAKLLNEDEKIAAEALSFLSGGGVGQGGVWDQVRHPVTSHCGSADQSNVDGVAPQSFIQRVHEIPLVNQSISQLSTAYAATKNYSQIVKYSAETVENQVMYLSRPVINTLGPSLAPLDRFACNQLDKLQRSFPAYLADPRQNPHLGSTSQVPFGRIVGNGPVNMSASADTGNPLDHASSRMAPVTAQQSDHYTQGDVPKEKIVSTPDGSSEQPQKRSRKDDMMAGLYQCLNWVRMASARIDHQIAFLTGYLRTFAPDSAVIAQVKKDIVDILRKCMQIIGQVAGRYLPGEARSKIRGFMMALPSRWASINNTNVPLNVQIDPQSWSNPSSGCTTPRTPPPVEAQKVLSLANESSTMLKSIESIFSQAVDGAELVLGKPSGLAGESSLGIEMDLD